LSQRQNPRDTIINNMISIQQTSFLSVIMMIQIRMSKYNNRLKENDYTPEEEAEIYNSQLKDILQNTRWYLDNIESMAEYRVRWVNYAAVNITKPKGL